MVQTASALMPMPSFSHSLSDARPAASEEQLPVLDNGWHRAPNGAGAGLVNMGNTCYMNSVLQCLAHLPPLANIVHAQAHSRTCTHYQKGTCICCLVENQLWHQLYFANRSPFKPDRFYDGLLNLRRGFQRWRQEDAHELLRCLTDAMEACLLRQSLGYNPQRPPRCPKTWVNCMFSGILQSQVKCMRCGHLSNSYDPFMDLSLELHASCRQLSHCLQHFTAAEILDGKNSYRCDGCKQLVPAQKQMTIWDDPNILVVHLKRFHDFSGQKISQPIAFPTTLGLEAFMCPTRAVQQQQQRGQGPQQQGPQQQQQHSLLGPARQGPQQQQPQQQRGGVAVFNGSGYTRVGGGGGAAQGGWGEQHAQRQQQQQQEKLLMHQQHQQHQHLLHKKAAGQQQQQHHHQHPTQQPDPDTHHQQQDAAAPSAGPSSNRSTPGVYELHGVLVHKGFTANSGHYYAYVRGGNPSSQWFCANDSSVYRVQSPSEVLGQTRDAYLLFYVRRSMKQQADLPVQPPEPAAAGPAAGAAAVAAGRLKRPLSSVEGSSNGSQDSCGTRVFGLQLPPHLQQKRPRVEQQQQQAPPDVDMFADGDEQPAAAAAGAIGPQLPPGWRPAAAAAATATAAAAAAAIGPQLPPGWRPSAAAVAAAVAAVNGTSGSRGSSAASDSTTAGPAAAGAMQGGASAPPVAAANPSTQANAAAAAGAGAPRSPAAAAAATAAEARAAAARVRDGVSAGSSLQQAAAIPLPAAPVAAAAPPAGAGSAVAGALAGLLPDYEDEEDCMPAAQPQPAPAPQQPQPQQQHQAEHQLEQQQQPAQEPEAERAEPKAAAGRTGNNSSGGGGGSGGSTAPVVAPDTLKSELWDAIEERKPAFKPQLVELLQHARDKGQPLPQVKPMLLTLFRGSAAVKEAAESVLTHAVKMAQSALSICL